MQCVVAADGNTRPGKGHCRSIFLPHAVSESMAAPGCDSGGARKREMWFTNIFMPWALIKVRHRLHYSQ